MLKTIGKILIGLIAVLAIAALTVHFKYSAQRDELISFTPPSIEIPQDPVSLEEGQRMVRLKGCMDCHGTDFAGKLFVDGGPIGRYSGSNITPGGVVKNYTDIDWIRAIRYGLNPEGRKLIFMPSTEFSQLTNQDLGKIIAYLKSLPPANSSAPGLQVGPLAKILYLAGQFPLMFQAELIDRTVAPQTELKADTSVQYGKYLAASCTGCHGVTMKGGPIAGVPPEWPPAADLTRSGKVQKWSKQEFETTLRTGKTPDGKTINPTFMPWTSFAAMNETEMTALYNYIQTL